MLLLVKRGAHTPFGVIVLGVSKMLCGSRKEARVTDEGILTTKQVPGFQITTVFLTLYLGQWFSTSGCIIIPGELVITQLTGPQPQGF